MTIGILGLGSDQVFYPSCVVNLRLLFDEALLPDAQGNVPMPLPQTGIVNAQTVAMSAAWRPSANQMSSSRFSFVLNRVPRMASVELPQYRTAGKFVVEFDWREIPIDPRLVRAAAVEVYGGSVSPEDFGTGMVRVEQDGTRRSILRVIDDHGFPRDDLMLLSGVVDNWSVERSDTSSVKLEGRDPRGVFLDSPINPEVIGKVDLSRDIVQVVHDILLSHPASQFMYIVYNPNDWDNGVIPTVADVDGLTRVRRKAAGDQASGAGQQTGDQTNFWDLITQYCFLVGAVPFFRGRFLVIRPAKSLFDQSKPSGQQPAGGGALALKISAAQPGSSVIGQTWDPVFATDVRIDDDGNSFAVRKFIYGRNLKKLSFERKFTGSKAKVFQLVGYDTSSKERGLKKLITAEYPPQSETAARTTTIGASGDTSQTDVQRIPVGGVRDQAQLNEMAKNLYEEVGRGEMGGSAETKFLSSYKGDNSDPDIMRLRPGHAVDFSLDGRQMSTLAPAANTELALERMGFAEAVNFVKQQLGSTDAGTDALARAIISSMRSSAMAQLQRFRAANVKFDWSAEGGMRISFDFQNYIVLRADVPATTGPNTTSNKVAVARTPRVEPRGSVPPTHHKYGKRK